MSANKTHFLDICFQSDLPSTCYFHFSDIIIGIVFLVFNIFAFIKMTKFYGQICFENMIILLSTIQLFIVLIEMIIFDTILIYIFIFLQILLIFLINNKFIQISKGIMKLKYYDVINKIIFGINICYFVALIVLYFIKKDVQYTIYIYYFIELISAIALTLYCCKFLNIIKKKLYNKRNQSNVSAENNKKESSFKKYNEIKTMYFFNLFYFDSDEGNELFYSIKRKQLTLLYLFNIICTIVECILESCHEFLNANQEQKELMVNFYFLVSLFHNIIIFFSFYFIIREQFKSINLNVLYNDSEDPDGDGLIDDDFIEEQVKNMQEEKKLTEQTKKREDRDGRISYSTEDFEYLNNNTKNSSILV